MTLSRISDVGQKRNHRNIRFWDSLLLKTADRFLWSKPFIRQSYSQAEASFADTRNYIYQGNKIDQQVPLEYDLAATQQDAFFLPFGNLGGIPSDSPRLQAARFSSSLKAFSS